MLKTEGESARTRHFFAAPLLRYATRALHVRELADHARHLLLLVPLRPKIVNVLGQVIVYRETSLATPIARRNFPALESEEGSR